jgi:hypothetical protein
VNLLLRSFLIFLVASLLLVRSVGAAERWRILGVPLDMPESDDQALDGQYLEGIYQGDYGEKMAHNYGGYIGGNVKDSLLLQLPYYHMNSTTKDGQQLELWFSSKDDGRKIFGVEMHESQRDKGDRSEAPSKAIDEAQAAFGKPDRVISSPDAPGETILMFVDADLPKDRRNAIVAHLPNSQQMPKDDIANFNSIDLRERARVLGPDFRGAIVTIYSFKEKVTGIDAELLDLRRARTVFNLEN